KNKASLKSGATGTLHGLTLWKLPDSYTLDEAQKICVLFPPSLVKSCLTAQEFSAAKSLLADSLEPGKSITVQGYLKPKEIHNTSSLTAIVSWYTLDASQPPVALSASQAVGLGENQVLDTDWWRWPTFDDFMKIVFVPIVLLLIGAITGAVVNWVNSRRDARTAAAATKA